MFAPSRAKGRRLEPLGISTHVGTIRAIPCWGPIVARDVAGAIIGLQRTLNKPKREALRAGNLKAPLARLKLSGPIPWTLDNGSHTLLGRAAKRTRKKAKESLDQEVANPPIDENVDDMTLSCPHCNTARFVKVSGLIDGTDWRTLLCGNCKRQRRSHRWKCSHNISWHTCPEHRAQGMTVEPPNARKKPTPAKKPTR